MSVVDLLHNVALAVLLVVAIDARSTSTVRAVALGFFVTLGWPL